MDKKPNAFVSVLKMVLDGKGEEVENKNDLENAEAVISLVREHLAKTPEPADSGESVDGKEAVAIEPPAEPEAVAVETPAEDPEAQPEPEATVAPSAEEIAAQARTEERARIARIREACGAMGLSEQKIAALVERDLSAEAAIACALAEAEGDGKPLTVAPPDPVAGAPKIGNKRGQEEVARVQAYMREHNCDFRTAAIATQKEG